VSVGCQEQQAKKADSSTLLLQPSQLKTELATKWVKLYGDDSESVVNFNLVLMRLTIDRQAAAISNLVKQLDPNDPNSLAYKIEELQDSNEN
jgi:hypothetical protein